MDTCAASMLSGELRTEPGSGAAGSVYRTLVLTNDSAEACSMFGFPGVSYRDAAGEQVGAPADREGGVSASEVVLQPGSSAFTVLQQTNAGNYGDDCLITDTVGLRVYPPNATDWLLVNQDSTACATPEIALLTVGVFEEA